MLRIMTMSAAALLLPLGAAGAQSTTPESTAPTGAEEQSGATSTTDQSSAGGAVTAAPTEALKVGAEIKDPAGETVGTIKSVGADGVVISTEKGVVQAPATAFAMTDKGLVVGAAKADIEAAASAAASK